MDEPQLSPVPELRRKARTLFEGDPRATVANVAQRLQVSPRLVITWRADDEKNGRPWRKVNQTTPDLTTRAAEAADKLPTTIADTGPAIPPGDAVEPGDDSRAFGIELRAAVIDRHKKEWAAPRNIAYQAVKKAQAGQVVEATDLAKLSKVLAETLTLVQAGECRAHNIRQADLETPFLIERSDD